MKINFFRKKTVIFNIILFLATKLYNANQSPSPDAIPWLLRLDNNLKSNWINLTTQFNWQQKLNKCFIPFIYVEGLPNTNSWNSKKQVCIPVTFRMFIKHCIFWRFQNTDFRLTLIRLSNAICYIRFDFPGVGQK